MAEEYNKSTIDKIFKVIIIILVFCLGWMGGVEQTEKYIVQDGDFLIYKSVLYKKVTTNG